MYNVLLIDGYVDEPSCLGVPPFVSPYIRYLFGLLKSSIKVYSVKYITIDSLRKISDYNKKYLSEFNLIILFAGLTVPGKYLNAKPVTYNEIKNFEKASQSQIFILCGPIWLGYQYIGGRKSEKLNLPNFDFIIKGYPESGINDFLETGNIKNIFYQRNYDDIKKYFLYGSELVHHHPLYPTIICEIETGQGCRREKNCSFCIEGLNKRVIYRDENDIIDEITELYNQGIKYFRIGNQTDIFSYKFDTKPNYTALETILKTVWQKCPDIKVLHTDNASPSVISNFYESENIIKLLVDYTTAGNSLPLGLESADDKVIKLNNLNSNADETFRAIALINKYGSIVGENGLPKLLPALNFIYGLPGENRKTWENNFLFLKKIFNEGLLLRRINLRQVMVFEGTEISKFINFKKLEKFKNNFLFWKEKIRREIDREILKRVLPLNRILKEVKMELYENNVSFGRQIGSYPILVGIKEKLELNKFYDIKIIDYGFRSVTGIQQ